MYVPLSVCPQNPKIQSVRHHKSSRVIKCHQESSRESTEIDIQLRSTIDWDRQLTKIDWLNLIATGKPFRLVLSLFCPCLVWELDPEALHLVLNPSAIRISLVSNFFSVQLFKDDILCVCVSLTHNLMHWYIRLRFFQIFNLWKMSNYNKLLYSRLSLFISEKSIKLSHGTSRQTDIFVGVHSIYLIIILNNNNINRSNSISSNNEGHSRGDKSAKYARGLFTWCSFLK